MLWTHAMNPATQSACWSPAPSALHGASAADRQTLTSAGKAPRPPCLRGPGSSLPTPGRLCRRVCGVRRAACGVRRAACAHLLGSVTLLGSAALGRVGRRLDAVQPRAACPHGLRTGTEDVCTATAVLLRGIRD